MNLKNEKIPSSLFSGDYWRGAARQFSSVRMLAIAAMFIALRIALSSVFIPVTPSLRVYFTFFVTALGSTIYGPLMALAEGFVSDILGYFIHPSGAFFPGYTLSAMCGSLIYALFFYRQKLSVVRMFLCKLTINVGVNIVLGSLWNAMIFGKGFYYYLAKSVVKNLVMLPLETLMLVIVFGTLYPLLVRLRLVPKQPTRHIPFLAASEKRIKRADQAYEATKMEGL